jgi:hypothetical protein
MMEPMNYAVFAITHALLAPMARPASPVPPIDSQMVHTVPAKLCCSKTTQL